MNLCIDIQAAVTQRAGVGRYVRQLVLHLGPLLAADDRLTLFSFDFRRRGTPMEAPKATARAIRWLPGSLAGAMWRTLGVPPFEILGGRADVYHFPNFTLPPLFRRSRAVVTIHDLSFLRYPQYAETKNQRRLAATITSTARRADAVITDSQFSAGEIAGLLAVPAERIFPIHLGIGPEFRPRPPAEVNPILAGLGIARPYLLTVGTLEPRKNLPFLIEVFEQMKDFHGTLVIAGMPGWKYEPILDRIRQSPRSRDIRYVRYVPDGGLPALYSGADLFLLTSFYEGFGLPPIEAMACGVPVMTSAGGSLAEVVGPGGLVLDEFDACRWAAEAQRILTDGGAAERLRGAGIARAAEFTWDRTARRTLDVYRWLNR